MLKMYTIWLVKLCSVFLVLTSRIECKVPKLKDVLISPDYDSDIGPQLGAGKPVVVDTTIQIVNFRKLEEIDLTFTIDCFVYMSWQENRITTTLDKKEITLPSNWLNTFWVPSIYFKNGVNGNLHTGQFTTSYFVLTPLKDSQGVNIFMASRITIECLCDLDFRNYPHDMNECGIDFMSLSERDDTLTLKWKDFKISKRVYNPDFVISHPMATNCSATYSLGTYSCIRGKVVISRLVRRYFLRKYYPTFLIVCTSFLGFWVPVTSYPARACILTISLLSLITQQVQSQPVRSMYTISYNIWSNACIGLVSLALIEFNLAIVYEEKHKVKKAKEEELKENSNIEEDKPKKCKNRLCYKYSANCNLIDAYSRLLFPLVFGLFIILYIFYVSFRV